MMNQQIETIEPNLPEETTEPVETISARVLLLGGVGALSGATLAMEEPLQADCAAHDLRVSALSACDKSAAVWLKQNGADVVSLAGMQGGQTEEIADALGEAKLVGAGQTEALANAPVVLCVNDVRIGFLAYSERRAGGFDGRADILGLAVYDHVRMLLSQCDHVIVLVSAGLEGGELPLPEWRARYRRLIDAGASAVVDTGSVKGWEAYKHGLIFYGLGEPTASASLMLSLTLLQNGRLRYEARVLKSAGGKIGYSTDETEKQRINEQNALFFNDAAYLAAADAMCRRYYEEREEPQKRGFLEALLGIRGEAARQAEETRLNDLLGNESRRLAMLRALSARHSATEKAGDV